MARNPFEQLQDVVAEPRQAFEDIAIAILKCVNPNQRRIRVYRGDGAIDGFVGRLGEEGSVEVYQVKYFPHRWGDSQKQQIRDSYLTARESNDYRLQKWTLCVPARLTKDDLRWFDEWRAKQDFSIELIDGDDLTELLVDARCAEPRQELRRWGIVGLRGGGPDFKAVAFVRRENPERSGLTATIVVRLENIGDRTASGLKATISHAETNCVANRQHGDWEQPPDDGRLNPRMLRYRGALNPSDHSMILGIPLCERSTFPFWICIKLTANDCSAAELHCRISPAQIDAGEAVVFKTGSMDHSLLASTRSKPTPPTSPDAKELLTIILEHPVPEERGLTEVISSSVPRPNETMYIPNATQSGGAAMVVKKSPWRAAVAELVQLGWLLPPQENNTYRIYELNPDASV